MHTANPVHTSVDTVRPIQETLLGRAGITIAASAFVALCAHVSLPLPFTPVPLSLGNMAVLVVGLVLGPVAGFAALAAYLAEGALGMPVFAPTGPGGLLQLLGPTAGFLFSYPLAAAIASKSVEALKTRMNGFSAALVAASIATLVTFAFGVTWLASVLHLHLGAAFSMGVVPFLPGESLKIVAAAGIYQGTARWRTR